MPDRTVVPSAGTPGRRIPASASQTRPPRAARQAAQSRLAEDEEFGLYLWTAITTGARRGEVSALRENRFDFGRQQVRVSANYIVKQGNRIQKAPKDGEGRVLLRVGDRHARCVRALVTRNGVG
jgi:integrase